jgi:serine/threonine-protein kinase
MAAARMTSAKNLKGTKLGRYTLVEHLATGGMAEIFLATDEAEGAFRKELVLKILQPRWAEHPAVVDMFLGEARIAAVLNHPNIVDIYGVASEEGMHYIAMEYIRGGPSRFHSSSIWTSGRMSWARWPRLWPT